MPSVARRLAGYLLKHNELSAYVWSILAWESFYMKARNSTKESISFWTYRSCLTWLCGERAYWDTGQVA